MSKDTEIGSLIDQYYQIREKRKEFNDAANECTGMMNALELQIIRHLGVVKLEGGRGTLASASIKRSWVGTFKDPDKFIKWGYRTKRLHTLLERRLALKPFREMLADKKEIPGIEPFEKTTLSVTKL